MAEQRDENDHEIDVEGRWHNDDTAGVYVWCATCEVLLIEGDEFGDRLTPEQIAEAVAEHRTPPAPTAHVSGGESRGAGK